MAKDQSDIFDYVVWGVPRQVERPQLARITWAVLFISVLALLFYYLIPDLVVWFSPEPLEGSVITPFRTALVGLLIFLTWVYFWQEGDEQIWTLD